MQRVKLRMLLRGVHIDFISNPNVLDNFVFKSISTDTRSLKKDDLFIAIAGEQHDGHDYIGAAIEGGAAGVIFEFRKIHRIEQLIEDAENVLFIGLSDTRKTLGLIARNHLQTYSLHKIVVTGSAGKTTTKSLIHSVLSQKYGVVSSIASYNNDIGVPKTILNVDRGTEILVQELGTNHPGEIGYLAGIVEPDCALVTNVGPAHIGFFGSEENIAREKKNVYTALDRKGTAFLNADDKFFDFFTRGLRSRKESFGLQAGNLSPEKIVSIGIDSSEFVLRGKRISAKVLGMHGIRNATAAALVGLHFGLTMEEIREGIERYGGELGRGVIHQHGGKTIIDESYNANPVSVRASLEHVANLTIQGRKIFVFADMLELGDQADYYHRSIVPVILGSGFDLIYTYGELAFITGQTCRETGHRGVRHFINIDELRDKLEQEVQRGDLILVKGSRRMKLERAIRGI
jgi:UDP-N-acetylmuramoyl-tripeptide--D-alanyl-D-alanine ligase